MKQFEEKALEFFIFLFQVALGVGAKIALVSMNRKITKKYIVVSVILACFVGYITDRLCTGTSFEKWRGVAVSIMALISESTVKYILQNGPRILAILFQSKAGISSELIVKDDPDESEPGQH